MRFKIKLSKDPLSKDCQLIEASWPRSGGERFLVQIPSKTPQGVHYNSHLGVITLESTSDSGILVERMLRVRHRTCQWIQETGETTVQAEIVTSRSGCLEARIGFDLPENGQAEARAREKAKKQVIRAQMTGKVLQVLVEPGTMVTPETPLVVIEAMKMENRVFAARSGKVTTVAVKSGDLIQSGRELLVIDAS